MLIFGIIVFFILFWTALILWFGSVVVKAGNIGYVERLGRLRKNILKPGLHFTIPLIDKLTIVSTRVHETEFPAEPEDVEKENEDSPAPGKKAPYRVVQQAAQTAKFYRPLDPDHPEGEWQKISYDEYVGNDDEKKAAIENDELQRGLTTEVPFILEWLPDKDNIWDFVNNVGTEAEALRRLDDAIESALQEFLGVTTAAHASGEAKQWIDRQIEKKLRATVADELDPSKPADERKPWGIKITRAFMKSLDPGKTINKARAAAGAKVAEKKGEVESARAEKEKIKLNAEAEAYSIETEAKAMASPEAKFIAAINAAKEVMPKSKLVIAPSDVGAFAAILSLGSVIGDKEPAQKQ